MSSQPIESELPEETADLTARPDLELRILILAPTSNDAAVTQHFLAKAGITSVVCVDMRVLCVELTRGCGAILLADEALDSGTVAALTTQLGTQPSWSDLPVIIVTSRGGEESRRRHLASVGPVSNVSIIERPVRPASLVSTFRFALNSRRRQYQVRSLLTEREAMLDNLHEADRRKDEFLAMLAHELRNPLASIANAGALLKTSTEAECHEWATNVINRQIRQLAHLIDDLLDVSRITTGKIRLRQELVDAALVLDRACEAVRPLVRERNHELICDYHHGCLWVHADPTRLEQVLLNLLTNAAKYTPSSGRITLCARREGPEVVFQVQDNGMGISPDRLPEMFQLFAQGERSIARSEGGLGIGLTIVQKLVELHGGRVEAHSEGPDCGSTFIVCLPASAPNARTVTHSLTLPPKSKGPGLHILVVDDNVDSAQGLARLLKRSGHTPSVVHNGRQALEEGRRNSPQAVVLDIGLPDLDGYALARLMRQEQYGRCALIIALTGYGQEEDRIMALEAGFDHHLTKPVKISDLQRLLADFASSLQPAR